MEIAEDLLGVGIVGNDLPYVEQLWQAFKFKNSAKGRIQRMDVAKALDVDIFPSLLSHLVAIRATYLQIYSYMNQGLQALFFKASWYGLESTRENLGLSKEQAQYKQIMVAKVVLVIVEKLQLIVERADPAAWHGFQNDFQWAVVAPYFAKLAYQTAAVENRRYWPSFKPYAYRGHHTDGAPLYADRHFLLSLVSREEQADEIDHLTQSASLTHKALLETKFVDEVLLTKMSEMITKAGAAASIERASQISHQSCGDGSAAFAACESWYDATQRKATQDEVYAKKVQHWHDVETIARELAEEWKLQPKLRGSPELNISGRKFLSTSAEEYTSLGAGTFVDAAPAKIYVSGYAEEYTSLGAGTCVDAASAKIYVSGYSWIGPTVSTSGCRKICTTDPECTAYQQSGTQSGDGGTANCVIHKKTPTKVKDFGDGWGSAVCYVKKVNTPDLSKDTPDLSKVFFDWDKSVKLGAGYFQEMAKAASW